jgi:hypothetical protein
MRGVASQCRSVKEWFRIADHPEVIAFKGKVNVQSAAHGAELPKNCAFLTSFLPGCPLSFP